MRKLLLPLLLACAACTSGARTPAPPPAPAAQPAAATPAAGGTLEQIRALIGAAACTKAAQCRTLPLGARACGGPEGYLPWSSAQTSGQALAALGERYKAERTAQNAASGAMSDCRFIADPGALCRAGTCQLGTGMADR
jgi:hypothetical protein